ncbi:polysaccharide deacetylase family protein [Antarcticibacterium arcticum]|uniref:Polysaccharide deacetylase family protein n=1 Tax=Antarcticibacterium arcticum TaxID=2585771 RepID=A0A5B8YHF0_9FLAO|nr:glycoside hydrolase family 57 protein [Antarcticibacterium arcticum]QED37224.1 polysaccharide deacetylase family protein [Antarcticibacterium arcticum]
MKYAQPNHKHTYLNLYFQVHQPRRLRNFEFFDIGTSRSYFNGDLNRFLINRIAHNCYLPANNMLLQLIKANPAIKITFSISGTALDQFNLYAPQVIESFRELAKTGCVEFLGETYYHSLSFLINEEEFCDQIKQHSKKIREYFGIQPSIFRNTELLYSNYIAKIVTKLGFKGIYLEGVERLFEDLDQNKLFKHPHLPIILFPRNYILSDDIAFRYSNTNWSEWPLTATKYISWLENLTNPGNFICIGMDYETLGEHHRKEEGIFAFMEEFISKAANSSVMEFLNPTRAMEILPAKYSISSPGITSWADVRKDKTAWLGNELQRDAFASLKKLNPLIKKVKNPALIRDYKYLQTSDHFYYMSKETDDDGQVHQYFSHYNSAYEAFLNYMNVLADLEWRIKQEIKYSVRRNRKRVLKKVKRKS